MKKATLLTCITSLVFLVSGCGSTTAAPIIKSPNYHLGEQDGCATAKGTYSKDSTLFQNDSDYEKGWFAGRRNCNPAFHRK